MNTTSTVPADLPLAQNLAFRSMDLEETACFLDTGNVLEKRKLTLLERGASVNTHISVAGLSRLQLIGVHLGADMIARSAPLRVAQIVIPVRGKLVDRTLGEPVLADCGRSAIVHMPDNPVEVQWDADTAALVIRIPAEYFRNVYRALTQKELTHQVRLQPHLDLRGGAGRSLLEITRNLVSVIEAEEEGDKDVCIAGLWEELLVTTLLTADCAIRERITERRNTRPVYGYMKRTTDYIMANIAGSLSVQDLTREAGVSLRTLQYGFREYHGTGPMTFVRQRKLEGVYRDLLKRSVHDTKIADVAAKWGFTHASHFTRIYRQQFNELPSETLAK